jgi:hypothetical protein
MEKNQALRLLMDVMAHHGATGAALELALVRAEERAGIAELSLIDEEQLNLLLAELASEGGRIQRAAETIAAWRTETAEAAELEAQEG